MRKMLTALLLLLLVGLTAAGCGNNTLADYKNAVDKTDQIEKGQSSVDFSVNMDFNTEGMNSEKRNQLSYYSSMSGNFRSAFDHVKNQGIYRNYLNLGGLGFDLDVYRNSDEVYAKLPIIGKYIKLGDLLKEGGELNGVGESEKAYSKMIAGDTLKEISAEWVNMLQEEDVFKGKDIVLTTPDGEVKTTEYTITLNDSRFKSLEEKVIDILSEDDVLRSNYEAMTRRNPGRPKADFDEAFSRVREYIAKDVLESFRYTAYVDIDGYIVNEVIEVKIKRNAAEPGEPESIRFSMEAKNWDINKDQQMDFPVLTEENILKSEDLDQTMPSLLKDLFY